MPELQGKVDGISVRAPVATGSLTDLVVTLGRETSRRRGERGLPRGCGGPLDGILQFSDDPLVSTDIVGSAVLVHLRQPADDGARQHVKVFGWYDNEWGYSCRLVDVIAKLLADDRCTGRARCVSGAPSSQRAPETAIPWHHSDDASLVREADVAGKRVLVRST